MNISEEVGKTFLWKSITKAKDKNYTPLVKRQPSNDKSIRSTGIKERFINLVIFNKIIKFHFIF